MSANLENLAVAKEQKRSVFIPSPKNVQITVQLHSSHMLANILKILQARLQQDVNQEFPDIQAGFRKGRETRDHIANIYWIIEKSREFQKNIYLCFIDYAKIVDCGSRQTGNS